MQTYSVLELEVSYARPDEIERKLELARLRCEGRVSRTSLPERALSRLNGYLVSLVLGLKIRSAPVVGGASAGQTLGCLSSVS